LNLQTRATEKLGDTKNSSSFLKATTAPPLQTISESEKASYVAHINGHLGEDAFLKKSYHWIQLPMIYLTLQRMEYSYGKLFVVMNHADGRGSEGGLGLRWENERGN